MYREGKNKKQSIWRYPFCRRDQGKLVYDHWERERHTNTHAGWSSFTCYKAKQEDWGSQPIHIPISFTTLADQVNHFKSLLMGFSWFKKNIYSINKVPLVVRGRSSHEDGVWKSLPAVHYNQKEQRERERRDWNGCYSRITIRHQIGPKKYLLERLAENIWWI